MAELPMADQMHELVDALRRRELSPEQSQQLNRLLRSSEEARVLYVDLIHQHAALRLMVGPPLVEPPMVETDRTQPRALPAPIDVPATEFPSAVPGAPLSSPLEQPPSGPLSPPSSGAIGSLGWLLIAGSATIVGLLVMLGLAVVNQPDRDGSLAKSPEAPAAIARLQSSQNCVWRGEHAEIAEGAQFYPGQLLELSGGSAKLRFASGATVVIDSPARFTLTSASSMRLAYGTLAARVDGPIKDFVVNAPDASIVDLGTSFGVRCAKGKSTEVDVFEGAVKLIPEGSAAVDHVLGLGSHARLVRHGEQVSLDSTVPAGDRFGDLLEYLWDGSHSKCGTNTDDIGTVVEAEFADTPVPGAVDTFYSAGPGRGWVGSWLASGNPIGEVLYDDPLGGSEGPHLRVRFSNSTQRNIAREYGPRSGFDPSQPHVISWKWRFEGNLEHFADDFGDRIHFFGNPSFRSGSWPTNSWGIGLVAADRTGEDARTVFPRRWFFFDRRSPGEAGSLYDARNMVDSGMELKAGVVYHFAVVVYPDEARYDAAIRDDENTFIRTGMGFRNGTPGLANIIHFGIHSNRDSDDSGFSLDSIRVEPWTGDDQVLERLGTPEFVVATSSSGAETIDTRSIDGYSGIWYPSHATDDEYGYKYAGGLGTFPQQHVPLAVYSEQAKKTFFVYGGVSAEGELLHMVSYFDHATGKLARPRMLDNKRTTDANDAPTLTIDAAGRLWIFASSHGTKRPAFIWRSVEPYSVDAFERIVTTNFSYAQPWHLPSGELLFLHTRYGEKNMKRLYQTRSRDGREWSAPELLAHAQRGHYQVSWPHGSRVGTIFNFHPQKGGLDARTNLYYQETGDGGATWRTAGGASLDLPLLKEKNPALVKNYRSKRMLVYLKDLAYTPQGRPVALYLTSYGAKAGPDNGPRQFMTAHWNGSEWQLRPVTTTDHNYDHASLCIEPDGVWRMIGTTGGGPQAYQTGGEVEMWLSRDEGASWELAKQLTRDSKWNHHYPRRPLGAHPDFYAFWADGHASVPSESRLYFCTQDGRVYRMPRQIDISEEHVSPELLEP